LLTTSSPSVVTKAEDKKIELFKKQLVTFTKAINQVSNVVKKKYDNFKAYLIAVELEKFIAVMEKVHRMTYLKQVLGESVPNSKKLFSIRRRLVEKPLTILSSSSCGPFP
jgi:IS5 family transposase